MGIRAGSEGQPGYGDRMKSGDDAIRGRVGAGSGPARPWFRIARGQQLGLGKGSISSSLARIEYSP